MWFQSNILVIKTSNIALFWFPYMHWQQLNALFARFITKRIFIVVKTLFKSIFTSIIIMFISSCVCLCVCVCVCVCVSVCVCVCMCLYPSTVGFCLQYYFGHTWVYRSTILCCGHYTRRFYQVPSSQFRNISYFNFKDDIPMQQ